MKAGSNTAKKRCNATQKQLGGCTGKGFMPGKSGNPNGRPVAFDFIRNLAQQIGAEIDPVIKKSNAEIVLRKLMREDGAKFIEVAYGKTTENLNISSPTDGKFIVEVRHTRGENEIQKK